MQVFEERKSKIDNEIATCKISINDTNIEVGEMETCVNYVKMFIENLPKFWITLSTKDKIKLNNLLFPNGLNFENDAYRTPQTHSIYNEIRDLTNEEIDEMTLQRIEL